MSQFSVTELHKDDPNILTGNLSFGSAASVYYAVQEERKSMASEIWIGTVEVSYFHPDAPYKRVNAFTTIT
ncbi:MAG TPA: hypothetical protein VHS08_01180, partial [Candidatus Acidoferrales bacterium]|nr:hypothetical protein [Candidatus Acidoferrales bacterium]